MCYISKYLWNDWLKCSNDLSVVVSLKYYCNFIHNFMPFKKWIRKTWSKEIWMRIKETQKEPKKHFSKW